MTKWLPLMSFGLAIASLVWAAFVTVRKGEISRATMQVGLGLTRWMENTIGLGESKKRRLERSTLLFSALMEDGDTGIFTLPLVIRNSGRTPLRNVQVLLTFPSEHCLRKVLDIRNLRFADGRKLKYNEKQVTVGSFGSRTTVAHEFTLIRAGEGIVIEEPVVWPSPPHTQSDVEEDLSQRLRRAGVSGFFVLDVFVSAENSQPIARRFNVLWINKLLGNQSGEETNRTIADIAECFWGGLPKPGLYIKLPWEKRFLKWEAAEAQQLDLVNATHKGRRFRVAESEPLEYGLARIPMPNWNYHYESRPDLENRRIPILSEAWRRFRK